jgi:hypothetical protein
MPATTRLSPLLASEVLRIPVSTHVIPPGLAGLRSCTIVNIAISAAGLTELLQSSAAALTELDLHGCGLQSKDDDVLAGVSCPMLRTLDLGYNDVAGAFVEAVLTGPSYGHR